MRAIRVYEFGEPDVMRLEAVDDLEVGPDEARVRVFAAGVNPVETYIRAGHYGKLPALPFTPGTDVAGVVEAVGEGVADLAVGDRVYSFGTVSGAYAEHAVCRREQLYRLPSVASFDEGAALGVAAATAWRALFQKGAARAGQRVLVQGASGGVGSTCVQLARAAGLGVVGTAGTAEGLERVRALGAHAAFDHRDPACLEAAMSHTGGRGFDLVIEMLANVNLARDLEVLAPGGRVVVVGSRGRVEIEPRQLMARDASVVGLVLFNASPAELAEVHAGLFASLEARTLVPLIGRRFGLDQAAEAHRAVMRPGAMGKIVLVP